MYLIDFVFLFVNGIVEPTVSLMMFAAEIERTCQQRSHQLFESLSHEGVLIACKLLNGSPIQMLGTNPGQWSTIHLPVRVLGNIQQTRETKILHIQGLERMIQEETLVQGKENVGVKHLPSDGVGIGTYLEDPAFVQLRESAFIYLQVS